MSFSLKIRILAFFAAMVALLSVCSVSSSPRQAEAAVLSYALIKGGAVLYSDDGKTAVTALPENYFAVVLGESENGYTSVSYLDLAGKVESDKLTAVDYEPRYKFAEGSLKLTNDGHNVRVRSTPDHEYGEIVGDLPDGETLFYYGTAVGSAQVAALGSEWYFVRFPADGETRRGYVYSLYVAAEPIPENVIEALPAPEPDPGAEQDVTPDGENSDNDSSPLTRNGEAITIVALCLPVIVVTYLPFRKPPKPTDETDRT